MEEAIRRYVAPAFGKRCSIPIIRNYEGKLEVKGELFKEEDATTPGYWQW